MEWTAYGLNAEGTVCVFNIMQDDALQISFDITPEQSKKLRKEMKAAEKAVRNG